MNARVSAALATAAGVVIIALTATAFWLSYAHLAEVALGHGLGSAEARAWAWPACLDLFIIAGEVMWLRAALAHRVDLWAIGLTAVGSLGSIALNVAGVTGDRDPGTVPVLDYVVAAVPPTAALLAFGALMRQVHQALAGSVLDTLNGHRKRALWGVSGHGGTCSQCGHDRHRGACWHVDPSTYLNCRCVPVPEHAPDTDTGPSTGPDTVLVDGFRTPCSACSQPVTYTTEHGWTHEHGHAPCPLAGTVDEHADTAIAVTAPDYVPEEWTQTRPPVSGPFPQVNGYGHAPDTGTDTQSGTCEHGHPSTHRAPCPSCIERAREHTDTGPSTDTGRTRVLVSVPDLPPGYRAREDVSETVAAGDRDALGTLLNHMGTHSVSADTVGVRDVKSICGVGTARARRVLDLLKEVGT